MIVGLLVKVFVEVMTMWMISGVVMMLVMMEKNYVLLMGMMLVLNMELLLMVMVMVMVMVLCCDGKEKMEHVYMYIYIYVYIDYHEGGGDSGSDYACGEVCGAVFISVDDD